MACLTPEQIELLARNALDPQEAKQLRQHVQQCSACQSALDARISDQQFISDLRQVAISSTSGEPKTESFTAQASLSDTALPAPDRFPGYKLVRELSHGGQGVVYEAIQESTKRKVAIKVLLAGAYASPSAKRRFEREVELVAQLKHPNIISVFHAGAATDGSQFYVMDYLRGLPLNQYVQQKKLPLEECLRLFSTTCGAVQYAHQRGIIHRDLKPSNILVDADGNPKILDFGLARWTAQPVDTVVSVTQEVIGTLPYMSPEQTRGNPDEIDTRTDVYALGVILYELLTGEYPYPVVGQMADVLKHIADTPPTPPTRKWSSDSGIVQRQSKRLRPGACPIDDEVQTIVLRALAKERERRYQSAGELSQDVQHYLAGEPIEAKRDSTFYVLKKTLRRYKAVTTIALAFFLFGSISGIIGGVRVVQLNRERDSFQKRIALRDATLRDAQKSFQTAYLIALSQAGSAITNTPDSRARKYDINADGYVDVTDLMTLEATFQMVPLDRVARFQECYSGPPYAPNYSSPSRECSTQFDFDGDQDVDLFDFFWFLERCRSEAHKSQAAVSASQTAGQ